MVQAMVPGAGSGRAPLHTKVSKVAASAKVAVPEKSLSG